jgi:type IV secretory pathway protease TraF
MRFTIPNAFIVSTFAVLSLMAPVANAQVGDVATITKPAAGDTFNAFQSIEVTWYVIRMEIPSAECHHKLLTAGIIAGPSPTTRM